MSDGQRDDEYTCSVCAGTFLRTVSDDEALEETHETFGFVPPDHEQAIMCDGCWQEFLPWAEQQGLTVRGGGA